MTGKEIKNYDICLTAVGELCLNSYIDKGDITSTLTEQERCSYISCKSNQGSTVSYKHIQASSKAKIAT